jgi:hypothetical protein
METYTELCSRMLRQFKSLLRHDPCVFGKQQLVQMMAINMYQIEVAKQVNVSGTLSKGINFRILSSECGWVRRLSICIPSPS